MTAEPRDGTWAVKAERALSSDLRRIAATVPVTVRDISCHSTSCTVVTRWPSIDSARDGFDQLMRGMAGINCTREIHLDDPAGAGPYEATYVLSDCER